MSLVFNRMGSLILHEGKIKAIRYPEESLPLPCFRPGSMTPRAGRWVLEHKAVFLSKRDKGNVVPFCFGASRTFTNLFSQTDPPLLLPCTSFVKGKLHLSKASSIAGAGGRNAGLPNLVTWPQMLPGFVELLMIFHFFALLKGLQKGLLFAFLGGLLKQIQGSVLTFVSILLPAAVLILQLFVYRLLFGGATAFLSRERCS